MLTSDLVESVKRRAAVPEANITFTAEDFYALIDEEIESKLVPLILANLEEYYVADYPYNITSGQGAYPIPPRAIAGKLRDVQIISSSDPECIVPLERLDITSLYSSSSASAHWMIQKSGFYIKSNTVYMYPTPQVTQNILNLEYYMRPNSCVAPAAAGAITAINTGLNTVTVAALPASITTSTLVDLVKVTPGFECTAINQTITNVAGTVLTFDEPLPDLLAVGDYVCLATQTCVVQVPKELLPLLSQYVVVRVLSAQGDLQAYQQAVSELAKLEDNAQKLISPRVDGKPKRVVNSRGIARFV